MPDHKYSNKHVEAEKGQERDKLQRIVDENIRQPG
jgi:hypothetical protein